MDEKIIQEVWAAIQSVPSPYFKHSDIRRETHLKTGVINNALKILRQRGKIVKYNTETWVNLEKYEGELCLH